MPPARSSFAQIFEAARAQAGLSRPSNEPLSDAELDARLTELHARGRAAWPRLELGAEELVRFVAERVPEGALDPARGPDLFIACACAQGNAAAIAAFEAAYFPGLRGPLSRLKLDPPRFDEARQKLRHELFVAPVVGRPKIAEYGGSGELRGWLRVTAVRSALKLLRGDRRAHESDESLLDRVASQDDDPELGYLKAVYRPAFKQAFQAALESLSPREQNLLRQHFVDGLTVDQLGAIYRVHRATAARWVVSATGALVARIRARFIQAVRIRPDECDSIMELCQSQLGTTLGRRLAAVDRASDEQK